MTGVSSRWPPTRRRLRRCPTEAVRGPDDELVAAARRHPSLALPLSPSRSILGGASCSRRRSVGRRRGLVDRAGGGTGTPVAVSARTRKAVVALIPGRAAEDAVRVGCRREGRRDRTAAAGERGRGRGDSHPVGRRRSPTHLGSLTKVNDKERNQEQEQTSRDRAAVAQFQINRSESTLEPQRLLCFPTTPRPFFLSFSLPDCLDSGPTRKTRSRTRESQSEERTPASFEQGTPSNDDGLANGS